MLMTWNNLHQVRSKSKDWKAKDLINYSFHGNYIFMYTKLKFT